MITLSKYGSNWNRTISNISGLSSDIKPTYTVEGIYIDNGSTFTEIDTHDTYLFDAENKTWYSSDTTPQITYKRTLNVIAKENISAGDTIYAIDQESNFIGNEVGSGVLVHYSSITEDDKFIAICGGTTNENSFVKIFYINDDMSITLVNTISGWDGIPYSVNFSHDEKHLLVTGTFTGKAKWYYFNTETGATTFKTNLYADTNSTALDGTIFIGIISHTDKFITLCGDYTGYAKLYSIDGDNVTYISDIYADNSQTALNAMSVVGQFNFDDTLLCLGGWFSGRAKLYSIGINGTLTFLQNLYADTGTTALSNYVNYAKFDSKGRHLIICGLFTGIAKLYHVENKVATYVADFKADSAGTALSGEAYYIDYAPNDNEIVLCGKFTGKAKLYTIDSHNIVFMNNLAGDAIGTAITGDCTSVNFMTNKTNCFVTGYFGEELKIYSLRTWAYSAYGGTITIGTTGDVLHGARIGYAITDIANGDEGQVKIIASALVV